MLDPALGSIGSSSRRKSSEEVESPMDVMRDSGCCGTERVDETSCFSFGVDVGYVMMN